MQTITEKNDVLYQLKYDPSVKATEIGILIKDGTEWWYQKGAAGNIIHYLPHAAMKVENTCVFYAY